MKSIRSQLVIIAVAIAAPLAMLNYESAIAQAVTTVNLAWDANPVEQQVSSYVVSLGTSPGTYSSTYETSGTTYSLSLPNGLYYVSLQAKNVKGVSDRSNEISFKIGDNVNFSLVIQMQSGGTSSNPTWTTNTTFTSPLFDAATRRFFRMKTTDTQAIVETTTDLVTWSTYQTIESVGANTRKWQINLSKI
jgi:hypothetical protein